MANPEVNTRNLSSRMLDYIESVNIGVIMYSAELGDLINRYELNNFREQLKNIADRINEPLQKYLDVLFELQMLATFVDISVLPKEMQEDATKLVEKEREEYRKKIQSISDELNGDEQAR